MVKSPLTNVLLGHCEKRGSAGEGVENQLEAQPQAGQQAVHTHVLLAGVGPVS